MDLHQLLDSKYRFYNQEEFIDSDPIQIPRAYSQKEDVEIAGFIAAAIAWGKRPMIIRNANRWLEMMDNAPYDFVMNANEEDFKPLLHCVHRTFNGDDALFFINSLQNIFFSKRFNNKVIRSHLQCVHSRIVSGKSGYYNNLYPWVPLFYLFQ